MFNRLKIFHPTQRFFNGKTVASISQKLLFTPEVSRDSTSNNNPALPTFLSKRYYSQTTNPVSTTNKNLFNSKKLKNDYIYLYHLVDCEETYRLILQQGLYNSAELGKPIPTHAASAEKSYDIFFHPLRENETIRDLPFLSFVKNQFFVAIAIPFDTKLQVNNRLYSLGAKSLHLITIDEYFKMKKYSQEGLPEVRLTINHIPTEYFVMFGQKEKYETRDSVVPFNTERDNCRFQQLPRRHEKF